MHWQIHKDSTAHHAVAERLGQRLPVAIAIGCDPVVSYAATAPLPGDIDEYLFAGFLRGERVEMVDCHTVPLQVPAHAQIVLEGYVEPGERLPEGPVRRPHRLLHPGGAVPGAARRVHDHAARPALPLDRDVQAAAGGRPDRARHRADLPAAAFKMLIPDIVDYDLPEPRRLPQLPRSSRSASATRSTRRR